MKKCILHSDLNSFYASVECCKRPELMDLPVIVCGNPSLRHGVVIAKNQKAKICGIHTGDTVGDCKNKSKSLVTVHTDYEDYINYSKKIYGIYRSYSDYIENFGIDECWLDITNIKGRDNGVSVAKEIMNTIKKETGLTVSVGVSFNKSFAKLGSHLAGNDELIAITGDNFKKLIWNVPVDNLMSAGHSTTNKLHKLNIFTIGDLAKADRNIIKKRLGVNGLRLIDKANGIDSASIAHHSHKRVHKSLSTGITMPVNLTSDSQISHLIFCLTEELTHRMRRYNYRGRRVHITIKNPDMKIANYSANLPFHTCSTRYISREAISLYHLHKSFHPSVRAVTVTVDDFTVNELQLNLTAVDALKDEALEHAIDNINQVLPSGVFRASKLELTPITDYFSKHSGLHKVAFSNNVSNIE